MSGASAPGHRDRTALRLGLGVAAIFSLAHLLSLPVLVTFDGAEYVRLARAFGSHFFAEWDFGRTPLYPLALRLSFWAFGLQPLAAMLPNVLFALGGLWATARVGREVAGARAAAAGVVTLALYPTFIAYQHAILTEVGSFGLLALLALALAWQPQDVRRKTAAVAVVLVATFYFRPSSLLMALAAAGLYALDLWWRSDATAGLAARARTVLPHATLVLLVPVLLSLPWNRLSAAHGGRDYAGQQIVYGLLKQAVLPPDDPFVAPAREAYEYALLKAQGDGRLDVGGLRREFHWAAFVRLEGESAQARQVLRRAVAEHPGRFFAGVGRTLLLDLGVDSFDSENDTYVKGVVDEAATGAKLWVPQGQLPPEVAAAFEQPGGASALAAVVGALHRPWDWLLGLGALATVLGFVAAFRLRSTALLALTGVPLCWAVVHAFTLMASDRLVVPSHAFLVLNAGVVPWSLWRAWSARRAAAAPASAARGA